VSAPLRIVFLGLSITSSWGNGHATTYRALLRQLARRGHDLVFLERDVPYYATSRDLPDPPYARTHLYGSLEELFDVHTATVRGADLVVVGSYVPDGARVGAWVCALAPGRAAFYDIDTPVTLAALARGDAAYITAPLVRDYALYLSFTSGPTLRRIERELGAPAARALHCSADPEEYFPEPSARDRAARDAYDLGYLGTFSRDRQDALARLLFAPARRRPRGRFVVGGAQFPPDLGWPRNVEHVEHVPPSRHRAFYCAQRFTLNVTRREMVLAGWSPSVRLFEAAACGVPVISDAWPGLDEFFTVGREILVARSADDVLRILAMPPDERAAIGARARRRLLAEHTAMHRAETLERHARDTIDRWSLRRSRARLAVSPGTRPQTRPGTKEGTP
jgi:spore maturation protein CgeB